MDLFASIVALSCFSLVILTMLVYENARLSPELKKNFYITYCLLIVSTLADFFAIYLNGGVSSTIWLHRIVKAVDYIASPIAAIFFIRQIYSDIKMTFSLNILLVINTIIEFVSIFTGWIFYVDVNNFYHHGPFYLWYTVVYAIAFFSVIIGFLDYGKQFRKKNIISLAGIGILIIVGVLLQEINGELRTCSLALTLGAILQFIHFSEFAQQKSDVRIETQDTLIEKDALTGMLNRYSYNKFLKEFDDSQNDYKNLVAMLIDVNGLKAVNDTLGHLAGDELIKGAADCLKKVIDPYGKSFRTGGDEFVVILNFHSDWVKKLCDALEKEAMS